jgi:hypothetical protein
VSAQNGNGHAPTYPPDIRNLPALAERLDDLGERASLAACAALDLAAEFDNIADAVKECQRFVDTRVTLNRAREARRYNAPNVLYWIDRLAHPERSSGIPGDDLLSELPPAA